MNTKTRYWMILLLGIVLGAALPAVLLWNPLGWQWAEAWVAGLQSGLDAPAGPADQEQLWTCGMHPQVIQKEPGICPICQMDLTPMKVETAQQPAATEQLWTCGMHPQVIQKEPGICPICQMDLTPMKVETVQQPAATEQLWTCGMHPQVIQKEPGICPICQMDLTPLASPVPAQTGSGMEQAHRPYVRVDPSFLQNFAIRTTRVERGSIPTQIQTLGIIDYNEKNIVSINTKFDGWIEKASINYLGEPVRRGQVLFEIYSPALVTTQKEYLAAIGYLDTLSVGGAGDAVERARSLVESARERLRFWDISDEQIEELRSSGKIRRALAVFSPISGIVIDKMGDSLEGMRLTPGMNVFKIADLSTVWVRVEVFEHQIQFLRLGQRADITLAAFPGQQWSGRIVYLNPRLNPQTRTLEAFVEMDNRGGKLRPEMYASVEIAVPSVSNVVRVPLEAVLHSGERSVVIVQKDPGVFEPRDVSLGVAGGDYQEVVRGLEAGEVVVTSSQFLIDSESNLKEAISKMLAEAAGTEKADPAPKHIH